MPLKDLRTWAQSKKGQGNSGLRTVRFKKPNGQVRTAQILDGGTAIAAPTGLGATAVGSGGTFAAASYFWKVTAITAAGETTGSNEATAAIALNGSANLVWTASAEATGYKIYRGTVTNTQDRLVATVGAVTSFTDTGAVGTGNTVPGANTTAAGLRLFVPIEERVYNNVPSGVGANSYQAR